MSAPQLEVRRAAARARTRTDWLDSSHCFSFGRHYDPTDTHHGLLLVSNDDVVLPGAGFATHPHRDMEIVTWVVQGSLAHQDSTGHAGVVHPGLAQRMSAGSGIAHSERNEAQVPVRFVQMWVPPDDTGGAPGYEQRELGDARLREGLVPVAAGAGRYAGERAVSIGQRDAALLAARLAPAQVVRLPDAAYVHVFVTTGSVRLEGAGAADVATLCAGDAVRLTGGGGHRLEALSESEVLVWEMHASLQ